jgi:predicted Zn-dependent protease
LVSARRSLRRARLAGAEVQVMNPQYPQALAKAQAAETDLSFGSADWIRAQDIGLEAHAALERALQRR